MGSTLSYYTSRSPVVDLSEATLTMAQSAVLSNQTPKITKILNEVEVTSPMLDAMWIHFRMTNEASIKAHGMPQFDVTPDVSQFTCYETFAQIFNEFITEIERNVEINAMRIEGFQGGMFVVYDRNPNAENRFLMMDLPAQPLGEVIVTFESGAPSADFFPNSTDAPEDFPREDMPELVTEQNAADETQNQ